MRNRSFAAVCLGGLVLFASACGSSAPATSGSHSQAAGAPAAGLKASGPPMSASAGTGPTTVKTAKIKGVTVLTDAKGFTLYTFALDTLGKSNCNGPCARYWPPLHGPASPGPGVKGKLGTTTRSDGSVQVTYDGHPLYTYIGDTAPGQAHGNGLKLSGGTWHQVVVGGAPTAPSHSSATGGGY